MHEINVLVWMYGVGLGGTFVAVIYNIFMLLAVQTTYSKGESLSDSNKASASSLLMLSINNDWLLNNAAGAFVGSILFGSWGNWYTWQKSGMNPDADSKDEKTA